MSRRTTNKTVFAEALETATATVKNSKEDLEQEIESKEENGKEQFTGILKQIFVEEPKKKTGKAYTFYLDREVHKKLEETAKIQGISTSKVLNKILKTIYEMD